MKAGSFARKDNKPLTLRELKGILSLVKTEASLNLPIMLSSDEEGNNFHHLWSVDVDAVGQVTFWPAGPSLEQF
jgi:hypothetical protein